MAFIETFKSFTDNAQEKVSLILHMKIRTKHKTVKHLKPLLLSLMTCAVLHLSLRHLPSVPKEAPDAYYINLNYRHDRRKDVESVLQRTYKFERVAAVDVRNKAMLVRDCEEEDKVMCRKTWLQTKSHVSS